MLLMSHFRPINHIFVNRSIKLIVCDMAGTTVNENGIFTPNHPLEAAKICKNFCREKEKLLGKARSIYEHAKG